MARLAPPDYGVIDPSAWCDDCEPQQPIPGWRTPIALAGWGALIAILIALIVWGILQLTRDAPPQEPTITIVTPTTSAPDRVSAPTHSPTVQQTTAPSTTADIPVPSTSDVDTATPTTAASPSPGAFPLPSVITLPAMPGLPTEITLPPGL